MQKIVKLNQAFLYCCMVVMFCLHSMGYAAPTQGKPVSITIKNSTLAEVLRQVSKKSGLYIYFQDADLAAHKNVTIDVRNKPVENVLHELLDGRGLSWVEVSENTIAVKKKLEVEERRIEGDTVATITVTGKVVNEKGEAIAGATVLVKNSKIGTTTNPSGDFVLNDIKSNALIVISNVSSLSEEVSVKGRATIGKIRLKERVGELDEIVVIPYGSTTRRLNTGNVVSIKADEIEKQPINNPLYALQGRVAGLQIIPTTGLSGGAVNLQIRGRNTLRDITQGNADPLIVVDGLPVVNTITGLGFSELTQLSALSFINPNEIESIDVLKDADATSIYGSRGANGVILITTKKGRKGLPKVDVTIQKGWSKVAKKIQLLNTQEYLELRKEAFSNSGVDIEMLTPNIGNADVTIWDKNKYTDWQEELIGGTGQYNDIQGSISGGSESVQYLLGANYHKETNVFPGKEADQKGSARISITGSSPDQKIRANVNVGYMFNKNRLPATDFTNRALRLAPSAPSGFNSDGSLNWASLPTGGRSWDNPYADLLKSYEATIQNLIGSADISYNIIPSLTIRTQFSYNDMSGKSFRKVYPFAGRAPENLNDPAIAAFNTTGVKNISVEPQINYKTHISEGKLEVLLGSTYQSTTTESQLIDASGFTSDALLKNLQAATYYVINNTGSQYKYTALFGRINFNWKNKYLINFTARRDGSSRFGPGNQYGNFGSIGAAWIFTEEEILKNKRNLISYGKFRFTYGSSGNDGIEDYKYLERYQPIDGPELYQGMRGYRTNGVFNAYYAWEETRKMEIGLDLGFLNDKLLINTSYFRNRSDNQLLNYPLPSMAGPGSLTYNLPALIQNSGLEFSLNMENLRSKYFKWSTSFNFTMNRNKLLSYPQLEQSSYYGQLEVGRAFSGVARLYNSDGVDPTNGQYQFKDLKGVTTLTPEDPSALDGGKYLRVMTDPKYYGGVSNTFTYKGISLDIFIQFVKQLGTNPLVSFIYNAGRLSNLPIEFYSRWSKPGDVTYIQKVTSSSNSALRQANDRLFQSNFRYTDASFIRLKNVSLSYSISDGMKKKLKLQNLRVFMHAQNLLTFTHYKGFDPETQATATLPPLKVVTVGLNFTL